MKFFTWRPLHDWYHLILSSSQITNNKSNLKRIFTIFQWRRQGTQIWLPLQVYLGGHPEYSHCRRVSATIFLKYNVYLYNLFHPSLGIAHRFARFNLKSFAIQVGGGLGDKSEPWRDMQPESTKTWFKASAVSKLTFPLGLTGLPVRVGSNRGLLGCV